MLPILALAAGTGIGASTVASGMGIFSAYQQGKAQNAMARYNAKVAENEAIARQQAIEAESRRLANQQRKIGAQQRMSVAGRGGLVAGSDLLQLAEQAKEMQLDQLELQRQSDIARIRGAAQSAMAKYEGKMAKTSSRWLMGQSVVGGFQQGASTAMSFAMAG